MSDERLFYSRRLDRLVLSSDRRWVIDFPEVEWTEVEWEEQVDDGSLLLVDAESGLPVEDRRGLPIYSDEYERRPRRARPKEA